MMSSINTRSGSNNAPSLSKPIKAKPATAPTLLNSPKSPSSSPAFKGLTQQSFHAELSKHTDVIITSLKCELTNTRNELLLKIQNIEQQLAENVKNINSAIFDLSQRVSSIEHVVTNSLTGEVSELRKRCDMLERKEFIADAVVFGIPQLPKENLTNIINTLCDNIKITPPMLKSSFRTKPRNRSDEPAAILHFASAGERNKMLRALSDFRKKNKRQLLLSDFGFDAGSRKMVFVNESLTPRNRSLLQLATRMKKEGKISTVYTKSGSVHVKFSNDGESMVVEDFDSLNAAAERHQSSRTTTNT